MLIVTSLQGGIGCLERQRYLPPNPQLDSNSGLLAPEPVSSDTRGELGREVPVLPFLPLSSTKSHLCQGIVYSSLGPDTAGKSCAGISTGTRVTFCIDRAEGQLLSSHFLVSLAQPSSGEHRIAQKSDEPCREWLEQASQRRAPYVVVWLWASQLTSLSLHFLT